MYRPGHHGAAMIVYAPIGAALLATGHGILALAGGVIIVGGTMVPDYDRDSRLLQRRGLTHTIWFALFFGGLLGLGGAVIGYRFGGQTGTIGLAAFGLLGGTFAILTHIAADALTPGGVTPFAPVRDNTYALESQYTVSPPANYVLLAIGTLTVALALLVGNAVGS